MTSASTTARRSTARLAQWHSDKEGSPALTPRRELSRRRRRLRIVLYRWRRKHPVLSALAALAALTVLLSLMRTTLTIRLWTTSLHDWQTHNTLLKGGTSDPDPSVPSESLWSGEVPSRVLDYHVLEFDELSAMVARTKGFYARDYSLWLGWNNVRPTLLHLMLSLNCVSAVLDAIHHRRCVPAGASTQSNSHLTVLRLCTRMCRRRRGVCRLLKNGQ